jgi:hypothetical protein
MSIRTERLGAVIQKDLGEILQLEYQLSGSFITVTRGKSHTRSFYCQSIYQCIFTRP